MAKIYIVTSGDYALEDNEIPILFAKDYGYDVIGYFDKRCM